MIHKNDVSKPSFKQSMEISSDWCSSWEQGELSDEVLADLVGGLIRSIEGARGFFAVSLSVDCPLLDRLPEPLIIQFRSVGEIVIDITVKNMAMSTAMAVVHEEKNDFIMMERSRRISRRCQELLINLEPHAVKNRLEKFLAGLEGSGEDSKFIDKWGYNFSQKSAITNAIYKIAN